MKFLENDNITFGIGFGLYFGIILLSCCIGIVILAVSEVVIGVKIL